MSIFLSCYFAGVGILALMVGYWMAEIAQQSRNKRRTPDYKMHHRGQQSMPRSNQRREAKEDA